MNIQRLQLMLTANSEQCAHWSALAVANPHNAAFYDRLHAHYVTHQQRISAALQRAQIDAFCEQVDPFVVLIGSVSRSGHSMLARELSELAHDRLETLMPGHGYHPITAAVIMSERVEQAMQQRVS